MQLFIIDYSTVTLSEAIRLVLVVTILFYAIKYSIENNKF